MDVKNLVAELKCSESPITVVEQERCLENPLVVWLVVAQVHSVRQVEISVVVCRMGRKRKKANYANRELDIFRLHRFICVEGEISPSVMRF